MFMTYLWQSSGISNESANCKFSSVLKSQCALYKEGFGAEPALRTRQIGSVLIGQIYYDPGIAGWQPWADHGETGIVWNGVCEDFLGREMDAGTAGGIIRTLNDDPARMGAWNGMFSFIAWQGDKVFFVSAAAMCPTLWHTEGPYGWALGPRAMPVLEMAGNKPEPDMGALGLYLSYGFFVGGHSAFRHVSRIRDRQQIIVEQTARPEFRTYISVPAYLEAGQRRHDWNESVSIVADRLLQRTTAQIRHSLNPVVLLTAGRDSRSIAAAAKRTGYHFFTQTSGPVDSEDVVIAARASRAMGIEHRHAGDYLSADGLYDCMEQVKLWLQMSEGIVPINYCLHLKDFFSGNFTFPAVKSQYFHGVETGIARGAAYSDAGTGNIQSMGLKDVHRFFTYKNHYLKSNPRADELLEDAFSDLDNILSETGGRIDHWFGLYSWRQRGLVLGADVQSVYSPLRWAWLPLFDREITKLAWNFTFEEKISNLYFFLDVLKRLEPALADVPFSLHGSVKTTFAGRAKRRIAAGLGYYLNKGGASRGQRFWERVFFGKREHLWTEFIEKKDLLKIIRFAPGDNLLWNLATADFLAELFFHGGEKTVAARGMHGASSAKSQGGRPLSPVG